VTVYSEYTEAEQRLLTRSLAAAAVVVSASSPGRKEETVSEGFAAADLVLKSRAAYVANPLVSSIIMELEREAKEERAFPDYTHLAEAEGARERALDTLRHVVELLDAKATPDEAAGYRGWLMQVAVATANAGKEDQGFLGRGGVAVNDAERAALAEIAQVLGVDA
jgi:hypothetical protein